MYLAELELHGFKSFANKTSVKFDSGITVIVGPNGCGKSNIVDALRWVLGEQRPSQLRSDAMANVIFNGTSTKKALGMAEVSVTIQNNREILPIEYNDVTISRRLYRSGESEYLINGSQCRLKDIIELFMDTGMGAGAYSVIELKMVEEILNDKNNDRRRLFEEAAGVTRYKEKRKQTYRKLDETRTDMLRVEDILIEIRKKARSLQLQANKAQRAKSYQENLQKLDMGVSRHEYQHLKGELEPLVGQIVTAEKEKEELGRNLEQQDEALGLAQETLQQREKDLAASKLRVDELFNSIRDADTSIRIASEKITNEEGVIRQYETDISQSEVEIREFKKSIDRGSENLTRLQAELDAANQELDVKKQAYDEVLAEVNSMRAQLDSANRDYETLSQSINEIQSRKIRFESRLENLEEDVLRIEQQQKEAEGSISRFDDEQKSIEAELESASHARSEAENEVGRIRTERDEVQKRQNELKDEIRSVRSRIEASRNEIGLLENIARSNEAFPGSVQHLQKHKSSFRRFEVVSDVLSTTAEYAVALESVLGEACNYVVVTNVDEATQAFELLRKDKKGKATVIPLDLLAKSYPVDPESIANVVSCAKEYEPLKQLLLGNVVISDSLEKALSGKKNVCVTRDGDVVTSERFIRSGSTHKNTGVRVGLRNRIDSCRKDEATATAALEKLQNELQRLDTVWAGLNSQKAGDALRAADEAVRKLENRRNALQAQKAVYEKTMQERANREKRLQEQRGELNADLAGIEPRIAEINRKLDDAVQMRVNLRGALQEKETALQRSQSTYNDAKLQQQGTANLLDNQKRDIERASKSIEAIKERLENRAQRARSSKDLILSLKNEIEGLEASVSALKGEKEAADKLFSEAEEATARQRGRINQIEDNLRTIRRNKDLNSDLIHHLSLAKSQKDIQLKNIADHIWETYGILMDKLTVELPEDMDVATAKSEIAQLRERLRNIGEVNPLAITEYEEEKERVDFYETQIADLTRAEDELRQTIREINETAQERFSTTFDQIRTNFKKVFSTLFQEDDQCDLILEESSDDPLDHKIEIIAKPRGKRPSNIEQLSGGEKTLTAIALLFAIYLVKPSPFCILDEVDAPLDDANIERFTHLIKQFSADTQFIVITHNKKTMDKSEIMYGVTMPETGVSKLVGVRMDDVA
ncbi:MAG: chromosome segregation protein SMC [Balneolaceae bacterium]|nr:MAG: chromosome segregation protein SMC [Balneolaceae bacterium]